MLLCIYQDLNNRKHKCCAFTTIELPPKTFVRDSERLLYTVDPQSRSSTIALEFGRYCIIIIGGGKGGGHFHTKLMVRPPHFEFTSYAYDNYSTLRSLIWTLRVAIIFIQKAARKVNQANNVQSIICAQFNYANLIKTLVS